MGLTDMVKNSLCWWTTIICHYNQKYCSIRAYQSIEHEWLYYLPRYHLCICVFSAVVRVVVGRVFIMVAVWLCDVWFFLSRILVCQEFWQASSKLLRAETDDLPDNGSVPQAPQQNKLRSWTAKPIFGDLHHGSRLLSPYTCFGNNGYYGADMFNIIDIDL